MSRRPRKTPSACTDLPLERSDAREKLRVLAALLGSCFGPTGRLKQIHNSIGGPVVTTSTSSVLLAAISSSQPLINLITASIQNHVARFSDCGLFAAILCLSLTTEAQKASLRPQVSTQVNQHLLGVCLSYLRGPRCACRVNLDFSSSRNLLILAQSVLSSKPACVLTASEAEHVARLALQAFLLSVPSGGASAGGPVRLGRVVPVCCEGFAVLNSSVVPGLLLHIPEAPPLHKMEDGLRVAVFSASLAGDLPEMAAGGGWVEVRPGVDTDLDIVGGLLLLGRQLVEDGVGLLVCQKVVHPALQHFLHGHGVTVLQRLGLTLMEPLLQLTGAQPVASLHSRAPPQAFGQVRPLSTKTIGAQKMLHLLPRGESEICTLLLCHRNETMLSELKVSCVKAVQVLRLCLRDSFALMGGGCTETHLAAHIRHQSLSEAVETASVLGCSRSEFLLGVEAFCSSLEAAAAALHHDGEAPLMDLSHGHHWAPPPEEQGGGGGPRCGCGGLRGGGPAQKWTPLLTRQPPFCPAALNEASPPPQPKILDSFTAKLNALQVAVETANLVMDVRYVIRDTN